ncbi:MAG: hypothetical protein FWB80_07250 [Defluviitaleaceae bacterium]|nr:hypothetical protein [Defluviitaleaceae bacterium]
MKKLLFLIIMLFAISAFAACGGNDAAPATATPTPTPAPEATPAPTPTPAPIVAEDPADDEPEERVFTVFPERAADVVWSLTTDLYFQNMATGERGGSEDILESEYWMGAGSPTYRTVENPLGGIALQLTDRGANYHAVDIILPALGLDTAANAYQITLIGNLAGTGNITIGGGDGPWTNFFSEDASGDFEMVRILPDDIISAAGSRGHIRLSSDEFHNITFYEIEIKRVGSETEAAEEIEETEEAPEEAAPEPDPEPAGMPDGFAYSMAHDPYIQGLAAGATTDLSGSAGLRVFNHDFGDGTTVATVGMRGGQRYLRISGRTHQNDGLLLINEMIQFEQNDRIVIEGMFDNIAYDDGEWFVAFLNANNNGWNDIAQVDRWGMCVNEEEPGSGEGPFEFRLSRGLGAPRVPLDQITTDEDHPGGIRLQTNRSIGDYDTSDLLIFNVTVQR